MSDLLFNRLFGADLNSSTSLQIPLDFNGEQSVCVVDLERTTAMPTTPMTPEIADAATEEFLSTIRDKLDEATAIARGAVVCCEAGNLDQAVTIALGIEPLMHDVSAFLGATTLIKRSR